MEVILNPRPQREQVASDLEARKHHHCYRQGQTYGQAVDMKARPERHANKSRRSCRGISLTGLVVSSLGYIGL